MTFSDRFPAGRFKFERSGFFGGGDTVIVYKDGERVDEFELSDSDIDMLDNYKSDTSSLFRSICRTWYVDNYA